MKCLALACDYDGTLAHDGVLDDATAAALDRLRASGRKLLMVTGRELPDLQEVCHVLDKFDWIVAENGALLYRPSDHFSQLLCAPASLACHAVALAKAGHKFSARRSACRQTAGPRASSLISSRRSLRRLSARPTEYFPRAAMVAIVAPVSSVDASSFVLPYL